MDTSFRIVVACGRCWVAIPAIASARRIVEKFASEICFLGVCTTTGKLLSCDTCVNRFRCWFIGDLRGNKMRSKRILGFDLFGLFVLSPCNECLNAGQDVFLGPTIHLRCPKYCFESHLSHLI